jgi:CheY-like chemotaxis protein
MPTRSAIPSVLVVDDNPDIADSIAMLLSFHGFSAHAVYSGREAVAWVQSRAVDCVVMDIDMPTMTGLEAARAILEVPDRPQPLLVALSALTGDGVFTESEMAGFDMHIVKPVKANDLVAVLSERLPAR